ncbi:MAG: hypothetical protein ACXU8Z_00730 [Caulobacteraceae bacterium]
MLLLAPAARAESPGASSAQALAPELAAGIDVDEAYRAQFDLCDSQNEFEGQTFQRGGGCRGDPNRAVLLRRLPGGPIAYVSKLAVDLDGSPFACGPDHGRSDQCPTSLMLADGQGREAPLDADRVPYVVIPGRGEFSRLTGVRVGDFGVVIKDAVVAPVIVGDTGPYNKLGEGSLALHRALGRELCAERDASGVCVEVPPDITSIEGGVTTILFPGSARSDLTPGNVETIVRSEGLKLWEGYRRRGLAVKTSSAGAGPTPP